MRAVKIDPASRMVTEINLKKNPNNTLQELYEIIGCDLVELIQIDEDMVMVVDEEGKCKSVQGAFTFIGSGIIIAGTAIILGGNCDRFKALPENLASFQMMTEWGEPKDVPPCPIPHRQKNLCCGIPIKANLPHTAHSVFPPGSTSGRRAITMTFPPVWWTVEKVIL